MAEKMWFDSSQTLLFALQRRKDTDATIATTWPCAVCNDETTWYLVVLLAVAANIRKLVERA